MIDIVLIIVLVFVGLVTVFFTWNLIGLCVCHVPCVSTSQKMVKKMIGLANLKKGDITYDLGCGQGRIVFQVAKKGIKCTGFEIVRPWVWLANLKKALFIKKEQKKLIEFKCADFFKEDLSKADVIFCYLWPSIMERLYKEKWQQLKKGTRIISHGFPILNLEPIKIEKVGRTKIFVYEH
ncbi:methyltransferase domain-containing protein [Candidatus Gracilibacteria bacterium]|nr:methyltransferase domain-containing protein [Candidatus Gracilibacteria bacterium]